MKSEHDTRIFNYSKVQFKKNVKVIYNTIDITTAKLLVCFSKRKWCHVFKSFIWYLSFLYLKPVKNVLLEIFFQSPYNERLIQEISLGYDPENWSTVLRLKNFWWNYIKINLFLLLQKLMSTRNYDCEFLLSNLNFQLHNRSLLPYSQVSRNNFNFKTGTTYQPFTKLIIDKNQTQLFQKLTQGTVNTLKDLNSMIFKKNLNLSLFSIKKISCDNKSPLGPEKLLWSILCWKLSL